MRDGDAEEAGQDEDGEGDDDDERGVADDAVAPPVVRGQLHQHGAQEGPREEALAPRAHPALQNKRVASIIIAQTFKFITDKYCDGYI